LYAVEDGCDGTGREQLAFSHVGEWSALCYTGVEIDQQLAELLLVAGNEEVMVAFVVEGVSTLDGLEVCADRVPFWW